MRGGPGAACVLALSRNCGTIQRYGRGLLTAALLLATPAQAQPRVVSLNLCTDQLLLMLAPEQIAALSTLARDPALSWMADAAADHPVVRADAEAVMRLRPTLVLAGQYGAQATLAALERRGVQVVRLGQPAGFDAIRTQITETAALLHVPNRGIESIATMDSWLIHPPRPPATALLWGARGWTSGPGTLTDAVLTAAGLVNTARGGQVGIEQLRAHPPQLLITATMPAMPSLATDLLRHPALAVIPRHSIPPAWLICGGPAAALAVQSLATPDTPETPDTP